jgi:hypothetical protein
MLFECYLSVTLMILAYRRIGLRETVPERFKFLRDTVCY